MPLAYVYEVIRYEREEEIQTGELVISQSEGLERDPYVDENPRVMGSNESLRPLKYGQKVIVHGVKFAEKS